MKSTLGLALGVLVACSPMLSGAQVVGEIRAFSFGADTNAGRALRANGWREATGQPVVIAQCRQLYDAIGHSWGTRDRNNEFNLPDLRGVFLRGVDPLAVVDKDAPSRGRPNNASDGGATGGRVGSYQADALSGKHGFTKMQVAGIDRGNELAVMQQRGGPADAARFANEASDVRPVNVAVAYWVFSGRRCLVAEPPTR